MGPIMTKCATYPHTDPWSLRYPLPPLKGGKVGGAPRVDPSQPILRDLALPCATPALPSPAHAIPPFRARTVNACHRAAVEAIHAAMWTHPTPTNQHADMRAAILSRINEGA